MDTEARVSAARSMIQEYLRQSSVGQSLGVIDRVTHHSSIAELVLNSAFPASENLCWLYLSIIGGNLVVTLLCLLAVWPLRQFQKTLGRWTSQLNAIEADLRYRLPQSAELMLTNRQALKTRRRYNRQQQTRLQTYLYYLRWSRYAVMILRWSPFRSSQSGKVSL